MLHALNKEVPLKSSKFLIIRYAEQDSNYWKKKYSSNSYAWQESKSLDSMKWFGRCI
jgi:hypothetical protein